MHMYARGAFAASVAFLTLAGCSGGIDTQSVSCPAPDALVTAQYPGKTAKDIAEHVSVVVDGLDINETDLSDVTAEGQGGVLAADGKAVAMCPTGQKGDTITFVWRSP